MPKEKRVRSDSGKASKKKSEISYCQDPIGNHIVALRTYHRTLLDHKRKLQLNKPVEPLPEFPEYPPDYPTSEHLEELRKRREGTVPRLHFSPHFSKQIILQMIKYAIKRILFQVGYDIENMGNDDNCLNLLSDIVTTFLKNFMKQLRYHKDSVAFRASRDLYNPLESVLRQIGFQGINGIAKYYYEDYAGMEEILYDVCKKELELIKSKYSVQNDLCSSLLGMDLPSTSSTGSMDSPSTSAVTDANLPSTSSTGSTDSPCTSAITHADLPSTSSTGGSTDSPCTSTIIDADLPITTTTALERPNTSTDTALDKPNTSTATDANLLSASDLISID